MIDQFVKRCRAATSAVYLGEGRIMCSVLGGPRMIVDAADIGISPNLACDGYWEPGISTAMSAALRPGMVAVDIGANLGYFTLLMAGRVGARGRVISVEANPALAGFLGETIAVNRLGRQVTLHNHAVSDRAGELDFFIFPDRNLNSGILLDEWRDRVLPENIHRVKAVTGDSLLSRLTRVDLIKIDVEGAEHMVWRGLRETLRRNPDITVMLEHNASRHTETGSLIEMIEEDGFRLREVGADGYVVDVAREALLDRQDVEDHMLFLRRDGGRTVHAGASTGRHQDPAWQQVLDFVDRNQFAARTIVRPVEMDPVLPGAIPYAEAPARPWSGIECVVLHKGWIGQLPQTWLETMIRDFVPAFANPVFVVYARFRLDRDYGEEHVGAFLEQVPRAAAAADQSGRSPRPMLVHLGEGRLLCRDISHRKLVIASRPGPILRDMADGDDIVGRLRAAIAPAVAGAHFVVDNDAGGGLFILAVREVVDGDALFFVAEDDPLLYSCARMTVDLGSILWRTTFATRNTDLLHRQHKLRHKEPAWDPRTKADVVHFDIDAAAFADTGRLKTYLKDRGLPNLVVTADLAGRPQTDRSARWKAAWQVLHALKYSLEGDSGSLVTAEDRPIGARVALAMAPGRS